METIHRFKVLPIRGIFLWSRDTSGGEEEWSIFMRKLEETFDNMG